LNTALEVPASPCICICVLDEKDICMGCYRTRGEISQWREAAPSSKKRILANAKQRQQDYES